MTFNVRRLAGIAFSIVVVCCVLVCFRNRDDSYPLTFPGGTLRKITYYNYLGKIWEVRAFAFTGGNKKDARELGLRLQKEGNFAVEEDFSTGEVFVYTARPASQEDFVREWIKSGGAVRMIKGPAELSR